MEITDRVQKLDDERSKALPVVSPPTH